jgi:hypothetical protein
LVAALLIVLWVRSYTTWDRCYWPGKTLGVQLNSDAGHIVLVVAPPAPSSDITSFFAASLPSDDEGKTFYKNDILGFYFEPLPKGFRLDVPFWFSSLVCMTFAILPWRQQIDWRFRLRTLLIATTLVAVVAGLAVWAAKR